MRDLQLAAGDRARSPALGQGPHQLIALQGLEERVVDRAAAHWMRSHPVRAPADRRRPERWGSARRTVHGLRGHQHLTAAGQLARPPPCDPRRARPEPRRDQVARLPGVGEVARGPVDQIAGALRGPQLRRLRKRRGARFLPALPFSVRDLEHVAERPHRAGDLDARAIQAGHARIRVTRSPRSAFTAARNVRDGPRPRSTEPACPR